MRAARLQVLLAALSCLAGSASAQTGCIRLSWNTCSPWVYQNCFAGPGSYRLVISVAGTGTPNVGTDLNLHLKAGGCGYYDFPDAWRFDDGGCQGGSRLFLSSDALDASCPALKGSSVQSITYYSMDAVGQADLRLAIIYDSVTPDPNTRYTLWTLTFDHSRSISAPSPPDLSSCGSAEEDVFFYFTQAILLATTRVAINIPGCDTPVGSPGQPPAIWFQGYVCGPMVPATGGLSACSPVPTESSTWGRLRATYH